MEQEVAATGDAANRARVEERATVQSLNDVSVNGDLNIAARDIINNHYYGVPGVENNELPDALKLVPNFRDIHIATLGKATPGTGLWIFVWETFVLWLDPDGLLKILWGSGMPGAGKTMLSSIIINVLEARAKASSKPICVAYVYIRYSDHTKITVRDLLEVLVKQTVERHSSCLPLAKELYERHKREKTQPTEEELLHLLQAFAKKMAVTFYVIDALDEAPSRIQLDLIEKLASLNVKLLITSRPMEDLDLHINREISRNPELRALLATADAMWREEIVLTIKQKAGGMQVTYLYRSGFRECLCFHRFLHASLQLDTLHDCTSIHDVQETLEGFPTHIEDVYVHTWNRILDQRRRKVFLAKSALLWVLTATRSLTLKELQHAVATCPESHHFDSNRIVPGSTITSLCRGLLTVEENTGLVRLVHYTAKEALETLVRQTFPHPHSVLAAVCVTCLIDCGFQRTTIRRKEDLLVPLEAVPFLEYAYDAWSIHAHQSLHVASFASKLAEFVAGCHAFPVFDNYYFFSFDILGPLHFAAYFNLPLDFAGTMNIQNPNLPTAIRGHPPLSLACSRNCQNAVEELLQLPETNVNSVCRDNGRSALMNAVDGDYTGIVSRLLEHADIEVNAGHRSGQTALILATRSIDVYSETIFENLLAHPKVQVNLADSLLGFTELMWAARLDSQHKLQLLLAHRLIQINQSNEKGTTALMVAARFNCVNAIKLLLAHSEIQANQRDDSGYTALMQASQEGDSHEAMVTILLAHPDVQVNVGDCDEWTALMWASRKGHEAVVAALLNHPNIQVDLKDNRGRTAAQHASERGHERIVQLLEGQA